MTKILDIDKLNIISDDNYYYFFRALNTDDHKDLKEGINNVDGKITKIRTDLSRFIGKPNYKENSDISLEEMNDHIKWCHTKDTNCISLSSNSNVIATYGRSNYFDEYVMVKVKKEELDKNVYLAVDYIASEVEKRIKSLSSNLDGTKKNYLELIDSINTDTALEQFKKSIKNEFKLTDMDDASVLDSESFLNLKKLILKLDVIGTSVSPKISNRTLIETIKFAYSSSEFIHYKEIPGEKVTMISSELLDIFTLLQQVPNNDKIEEIKNILLTKLDTLDTYDYNSYSLDEKEYSVANMYRLSNGSIDYGTIKEIVNKAYFLAKSRLRVKNAVDNLNKLLDNNSDYKEVLEYLKNNTYGIEPEISSRLNTNSLFLSETVSLNIDENERKLLDLINNLSDEDLANIVENKEGFLLSKLNNFINDEYENISGYKKQPVSENEYYVEAIVNGLNINSIYTNSIKEKKLTKEEKYIICNKLFKGNCKNLYNAFLNAGVDKNKIPYYIVNLYLSNGYKGYNFYDFSVLPDLNEIIYKNIDNLNIRISALDFDNLRGIKDDNNIIKDTNINLRDYQTDTVNNIKELYKTKRFAGVVLPTGAGKSFVAITMMLEFQNKNIVYIAPNVGINRQVQKHIIKNVIGYNKTYEDIAKMLEDPNKYEMYIKQYFPYLKFYCYQGMSNKEQEDLANLDADLIILDELHRTGASTWSKSISDLVEKNSNAKVLGLTATPVRTDGEDMTRKVARLTKDYSEKELILDKHLAVNMNLIDAIRDDIVVPPRIVSFDYNLRNSDEFEEIKEKYEKETDSEKKTEYKKIYDKMVNLLSKSEASGLSKIIEENLTDKYGKYLVFLPKMPSDYESSDKYFKDEMDKFASNIATIDSNPIQRYIYSDKSSKENDKELTDFELDESSHIKTLYAVDMLNEGIHVDNISGSFMFRPIASSKILYLQQLGRTVYSKDPDHTYTDEERPIVFDYYNNYFILNMDRMVNKTDATSDLERLKSIYEWIKKHGFIPDINSSNLTEARKAITLKKIKSKYIKYLDSNNLDELDEIKKNTIIEILEIANEIGLFGIEFPDRIIPPGEKEIDHVGTFELSATQKELTELVKESRNIGKNKESLKKMTKRARYKMCLQVLDILDEYSYPINEKNLFIGMTLKDIKSKLDNYAISLIDELGLSDDYPIGEEFNYIKYLLYNKLSEKIFDDLDLETAIKYGLFTEFTFEGKVYNATQNGFIMNGPSRFLHYNVNTGTKYDFDGYDYNGLDEYLFDKDHFNYNTTSLYNIDGFDYQKIHKDTGTYLDNHNFDIDGYWYKNENGQMVRTDSKLNDRGFNIKRLYHLKSFFDQEGYDIDGYDVNGFNKEGIDREGYDKNGFDRYKINRYTKTPYDRGNFDANHRHRPVKKIIDGKEVIIYPKINKYGFGADKFYYEKTSDGKYRRTTRLYSPDGFNYDGIHAITKKRYNELFFDRNGNYWELVNGKRVRTDRKVDNHNFDKNGDYYIIIDGELVNTHNKYDDYDFNAYGDYRFYNSTQNIKYNLRGFDINHIHKNTGMPYDQKFFDIDGNYYELIDGKRVKTDKKTNELGFDMHNYHWKKDENGNRTIPGDRFGDDGYDVAGYDSLGFDRKHNYLGKSNNPYNDEGFDYKRTHKDTGKTYDDNFFKINDDFKIGNSMAYYPSSYINLITDTICDIRGFDIFGKTNSTEVLYRKGVLERYDFRIHRKNDAYDYSNFDSNGIHKTTKTLYDANGYNAFRVDENGYRTDGTKHPDIVFTERYFDLIEKDIDPSTDEELNEYLDNVLKHVDNVITKDRLVKIIIYAACKMYPKIIDKIPHKITDDKELEVVNIDEIIETTKLHIDKNPRLYASLKI